MLRFSISTDLDKLPDAVEKDGAQAVAIMPRKWAHARRRTRDDFAGYQVAILFYP
jgi:hypothetical protein